MTLQLRHHHELAIDNARTATHQAHIARWTTPPCQKAYAKKLRAAKKAEDAANLRLKTNRDTPLANEILELMADGRERTLGDVCAQRGIFRDYKIKNSKHDKVYNARRQSINFCMKGLAAQGILEANKLPNVGAFAYVLRRVDTSKLIGRGKRAVKWAS